MQDFDEFPAKL